MVLEHWTFRQNVRQNKALLKDLAELLTDEIQNHSGREPVYLDFRFLLPLAQWLSEQGGYTMTPKHRNNPGNVMGRGNEGSETDNKNHEVNQATGEEEIQPGTFALYSSMTVGTAATFKRMSENWWIAYRAILDGGTPERFVMGLYPGPGKNYATRFQGDYLAAVRYRVKNLIQDFISVAEDDIKELGEQRQVLRDLAGRQNSRGPAPSPPGSLRTGSMFGGTDLMRDTDDLAEWLWEARPDAAAELDRYREQLQELKDIQKRFAGGKDLQPRFPTALA